VSIVNSQIYSNIAADVRARVRNFPSPPWENFCADLLASTLTHTTAADAPVNNSKYVPQRPSTIPSPAWETHVLLVDCREVVSTSLLARSR
jgi:hypothetical protein